MICRCCLEQSKDSLMSGIIDITSREELYRNIVNKDMRTLIITSEFAEEYFTPLGLADFIESAMKLNEMLTVNIDDSYLKQFNNLVDVLGSVKDIEELVQVTLKNKDVLKTVHELVQTYKHTANAELRASNKINTLLSEVSTLILDKKKLQRDFDRLLHNYNEAMTKFDILASRIKYTYRKDSNVDDILRVDNLDNSYTNILYIKEITRIRYVDTLVYQLKEILATLYNESVRSIVIEPYYSYDKHYLYPGYKSHLSLSMSDLISSDILMSGFQSELMSTILKNPNHDKFLIILDRGGWREPHLTGNNVKTIYTVSDLEDLNVTTQNNRIISYSSRTLYIPHIEGYSSMLPNDCISRYSSTEIVQELTRVLEVGDTRVI